MKLVLETKSYQNNYDGIDIIKSNNTIYCPTWWDAMEWVSNYQNEYDRAARFDEDTNVKIRTIKSESFLRDTVIVVWHKRGIDTIYIQMKW